MPRRRSSDPTTSIRITIPQSILNNIHADLEPTASRSAWIASACRDKLMGGHTIDDATDLQLAAVLVNRGAITLNMYELIQDHIKVSNRVSKP